MDDVVRKQPKRQRKGPKPEEFVEDPTGELVPSKTSAGLLRSKSAPKRKDAFHYPLTGVRRDSVDDDSLPNSPQLPEFAKTKIAKGEVQRGDNRLTM